MSTKDDAIQAEYREAMNRIAFTLDQIFSGSVFVLMVFNPNRPGANYISNGNRDEIVDAMREFIERHESAK